MKRLFIILTLSVFLLAGCQSVGKYQGFTAEEWFNEYDFSEANNQGLLDQIMDLEYEIDNLQMQLDDAEAEKMELEDDLRQAEGHYDDLRSCLNLWPDDTGHCIRMY